MLCKWKEEKYKLVPDWKMVLVSLKNNCVVGEILIWFFKIIIIVLLMGLEIIIIENTHSIMYHTLMKVLLMWCVLYLCCSSSDCT